MSPKARFGSGFILEGVSNHVILRAWRVADQHPLIDNMLVLQLYMFLWLFNCSLRAPLLTIPLSPVMSALRVSVAICGRLRARHVDIKELVLAVLSGGSPVTSARRGRLHTPPIGSQREGTVREPCCRLGRLRACHRNIEAARAVLPGEGVTTYLYIGWFRTCPLGGASCGQKGRLCSGGIGLPPERWCDRLAGTCNTNAMVRAGWQTRMIASRKGARRLHVRPVTLHVVVLRECERLAAYLLTWRLCTSLAGRVNQGSTFLEAPWQRESRWCAPSTGGTHKGPGWWRPLRTKWRLRTSHVLTGEYA